MGKRYTRDEVREMAKTVEAAGWSSMDAQKLCMFIALKTGMHPNQIRERIKLLARD